MISAYDPFFGGPDLTGGAGRADGATAGFEVLALSATLAGAEAGLAKGAPVVAEGRDTRAGRDAEVPL
jgi:hypothetical protein